MTSSQTTDLTTAKTEGHFGAYGGAHLPPHLVEPMAEVARAYEEARQDPDFMAEYQEVLAHYVGRPSLLYRADRLTRHVGGARIYLKREDLNHTGSHKINHCLGEVLLARRMGKKKVIAETGAGSHGVALATAATYLGLECEIHMGAVDVEKQHPNVVRMQMLGATVVSVHEGEASLKEAVDSAFAVYAAKADEYLFAIGSVVGPHPYPTMVRDFQSVIGREARQQFLEAEGRLPHAVVACVGGGSNAMGLFSGFLDDPEVALYGVEPGGKDLAPGHHAATMTKGTPGMLHGMATRVLQQEDGQPAPVHSIAPGLDYPGVGPQHVHLCETGRANYVHADDAQALGAFTTLTRVEGIIPALESAHAVAHGMVLAKELGPEAALVVNLSGRGDKDVDYVADLLSQQP
ncbi:tryptophan synthase subunit beta [Luteococcus sp. OSA5]|uniref:tryptophan synthase subunit beta n=1 Tax=Luteococcus sp. OSA5 TaxID=3401630 RepID=UPI003B42F3B1